MFRRRRDVRALRRRWARLSGAPCAPVVDEPDELPPEEISVETGELVDPAPRPRPPRREP